MVDPGFSLMELSRHALLQSMFLAMYPHKLTLSLLAHSLLTNHSKSLACFSLTKPLNFSSVKKS